MKMPGILMIAMLLMTGFSFGESVPSSVSYQGRLIAADGTPVTGMFDMIVRIYDDSTGGQLLGEHGFPTVPVSNGLFRLLIPSFGSIADPDPSATNGEAMRFLEVEVEGEAVLPRARLSSTPFSIQSQSMAGDIYTSPGRLYMVPNGPSVTDCTFFPLELAVDSFTTRFRMKPLIPPTDCTYFPLEFRVDASSTHLRLVPPDPVTPADSFSADLTVSQSSGSVLQMDHNTAAGIVPCVRVFNDGLASGLSGFDTKVGVTGSNDSALANLMIDGDMGSSLQLDYKLASGINPCVRVFSQDALAGMSIFGSTPPDDNKSPGGFAEHRGTDSRTADSSVINLFADTGKATIELYGGTSGADASIVLISNNAGGSVGVNTNSPSEALQVVGNICATGTIGACSDERYKEDIETIGDALGIVGQLRGVDFKWRVDEFPNQRFSKDQQVGFIAQEIAEVLPEVVSQGSDGFYSVDYARLTPVLVEAIKDQQKQIDELTVLVKQLASRLEPQPAAEYGSK